MPSSSPQSGKEPKNGAGAASPNAVLVREQLRRLLGHPLFTNSKRYPVLLAYTVEQTLDGKASELKERTIGIEAFGREPDYDVNLDPVVRTTAAEVRKRLVQYYYNPHHSGELVIDLPVGAYVPSFREPVPVHPGSSSEAALVQKAEPSSPDLAIPAVPLTDIEPAPPRPAVRHWLVPAIALLGAVLVGFGVGRIRFPSQPTSLERFWAPVTTTSGRVTYCLGEPRTTTDKGRAAPPGVLLFGGLDVSDVITLARSIVPLVPQHGSFRVLAASNTEFTQLREGPFVLIGAYDNNWTMRITQDLPFGFDGDVRRIVDRKNAQRSWTLQWDVPNTKLALDYAIVARIHDNLTGQPVIILGGILGEGTEAAGEVVSNPVYLNAMLEKAPKNWDHLNVEAVIETHVIEGHPGPPAVVAVEAW